MINPEARAAMSTREKAARLLSNYEQMMAFFGSVPQGDMTDATADVCREYLKLLDRYADETPIDEAWLRSVGFLPDGEDTGEFARKIWSAGETEDYGTDPAMHIVWSTIDDSCWLEAYDRDGKSLAVIELDGIKTRGQLRRLTDALGIELKEEPKP